MKEIIWFAVMLGIVIAILYLGSVMMGVACAPADKLENCNMHGALRPLWQFWVWVDKLKN